jgi:hypothetical protein
MAWLRRYTMATDRNRRWATVPSGLILMAIGILLLLNNLEVLHFEFRNLWSLGLAAFGLLFFFSIRNKPHKGAVFPGTILLLAGLFLFLWENRMVPRGDGTMWPAFLIIVGIAFVVLYIWDRRERETLVLGVVLVVIGAIFMADTYYYLPWSPWELILRSWPLILVIVGISILLRGWERRKIEAGEDKLEDQIGPPAKEEAPEA